MATAQVTKDRRSTSDLAKQQQRRIWRTAYLYILPAAIIMLLITFWPLIYSRVISRLTTPRRLSAYRTTSAF